MNKLQQIWNAIQDLLDVRGDVVMLFISSAFVIRVIAVLFNYPPITNSEAMFYGSAIASFAWSNKGPKV